MTTTTTSASWLRPQLLVLALTTLLLLVPAQVAAMKQSWSFETEDREQFLIERFGFGRAGHMDVRVRDVSFSVTGVQLDDDARKQVHAGLLFVHVRSLGIAVCLCI